MTEKYCSIWKKGKAGVECPERVSFYWKLALFAGASERRQIKSYVKVTQVLMQQFM